MFVFNKNIIFLFQMVFFIPNKEENKEDNNGQQVMLLCQITHGRFYLQYPELKLLVSHFSVKKENTRHVLNGVSL